MPPQPWTLHDSLFIHHSPDPPLLNPLFLLKTSRHLLFPPPQTDSFPFIKTVSHAMYRERLNVYVHVNCPLQPKEEKREPTPCPRRGTESRGQASCSEGGGWPTAAVWCSCHRKAPTEDGVGFHEGEAESCHGYGWEVGVFPMSNDRGVTSLNMLCGLHTVWPLELWTM